MKMTLKMITVAGLFFVGTQLVADTDPLTMCASTYCAKSYPNSSDQNYQNCYSNCQACWATCQKNGTPDNSCMQKCCVVTPCCSRASDASNPPKSCKKFE